MEKQQIISFITAQLEQGKISRDELMAVARGVVDVRAGGDIVGASRAIGASWNMINTLYAIGAIVGIVGVSILLGQHWTEIGFESRIGVTLGISFLTYLLALLLCRPAGLAHQAEQPLPTQQSRRMLSQALFVISAALAPVGIYVLLMNFDLTFTSLNQALTAAALFIIFAIAQYVARTNLLVILLTAFATWAYYALLAYVFLFTFYEGDLLKWATIVLGLAYILIAFDLSRKTVATAGMNVLYALGTLAVLSAGISLGGVWDFVYILFIFAAFYGSVYVKNQSMLTLGAVFLMAYVLKLTYRYFLGSLGWPVALIISGFLIITIGYLTFRLNRRYLGK